MKEKFRNCWMEVLNIRSVLIMLICSACLFVLFLVCGCIHFQQVSMNEELLNESALIYKNDLAKLCSQFSENIERGNDTDIKNIYNLCGIENTITDHFTGALSFGGGAYAIGSKNISINGQPTDVIVVTARGTQSFGEVVGDLWKGEPVDDLGTRIYRNIYDYEEILYKSLNYFIDNNSYLKQSKSLKFVINGHSLGGAAANYFAAKITNNVRNKQFVNANITQDDIYVYTFGAIKVLVDAVGDQNMTYGYENIHNLYNWDDSYGPYGRWQDKHVSAVKQKFGHTETFSNKKDDSDWNPLDVPSHGMGTYQEALENINNPDFGFTFSCKKQDSRIPDSGDSKKDNTPKQKENPKQNTISWLIGRWKTSDGWVFDFRQNGSFGLDMGLGYVEDGTYTIGAPSGKAYPITFNGTSLLTIMKLMYGAVDANYRFEILKDSDTQIYLVQVYGSYTAETSPCKLSLTKAQIIWLC